MIETTSSFAPTFSRRTAGTEAARTPQAAPMTSRIRMNSRCGMPASAQEIAQSEMTQPEIMNAPSPARLKRFEA